MIPPISNWTTSISTSISTSTSTSTSTSQIVEELHYTDFGVDARVGRIDRSTHG